MGDTIVKQVAGTLALETADSDKTEREVARMAVRPRKLIQLADMGASTAAEIVLLRPDADVRLTAVRIIPSAALTANDTNYKTFTLNTAATAAGSQTSLDSFTTKITGGTGDWVARTAESFTIVPSTDTVDKDTYLYLSIGVTASGVATPAMTVEVEWEYVD